MADDPCPCCGGTDEQIPERDTSPDRWIGGEPVLDAALPRDVQSALGRFLGTEPVGSLGAWAGEVRRHVGGPISVEELCHTSERTVHWGAVDGERHHFACFYDAVILAALSDQPVDVRTESPAGDVIEARAVGSDDLSVTPEGAVFSFGLAETVALSSDDVPTVDRGYVSICPYVKAFTGREAYERWAKRVPAATVGMPLAGATELTAALVRESSR